MTATRTPLAPHRLALLVLGAGLLATGSLEAPPTAGKTDGGPYATLDSPVFDIRLANGRLALTGTTASRRHETAIVTLLANRFAHYEIEQRLRPGVLLPDAWESLSLELLRAVAALESAKASLAPSRVAIRGVTTSHDDFSKRLARLSAASPAAIPIDANVTQIEADVQLAELCDSAFRSISSRTVEFERASARLRPTANAVLDKVIEFAWDCRDVAIRITGHSDASGDEVANIALSRQRAAAVAAYLTRGGVDRDRVEVEGKGSAVPIGSNSTAHGRRLNRRIEFSLTR